MMNMKKTLKILFFIFLVNCKTPLYSEDYSILFIHIGSKLPDYANTAFMQARKFNPDCSIILLANQSAIDAFVCDTDLDETKLILISCESLNISKAHLQFIQNTKLKPGFWRCASERFLYLAEFVEEYQVSNVFHLEYDNMLYANLGDLLPVFKANYPAIGATFDNDERCIPGFVYIANSQAANELAGCFARHAKKGLSDMQIISLCRYENSSMIDYLPIIHKSYVMANSMSSTTGHKAKEKKDYCKHVDAFDSIFDAAALGQYLGGTDPIIGRGLKPGFINESCLFNPSLVQYLWEKDDQERWVPFAVYGNEKRRINNLHIHSKKLHLFSSTRSTMTNVK